MSKMPYFHGVSDQLPDDNPSDEEMDPSMAEEAEGDGLHHHEMHEDEMGGYNSTHTHPDGKKDEAHHDSYDEARDHMDAMHGEGDDDDDDDDEDNTEESEVVRDDSMPDDMAGDYSRAAKK